MELPEGFVVSQEVFEGEDHAGIVARTLRLALEAPMVGRPRWPQRIRVADRDLAQEARSVVGERTPIEIAATPELDGLVRSMAEFFGSEESHESYLEGGRLPPALVGELFLRARQLYEQAPWRIALDEQILRMDIPQLDVRGACVSIIGNLGESLGILIFPSLAGFERFLELAEEPLPVDRPVDFGTPMLALTFERGADLPAEMRREATTHRWPVADARAYPHLQHRDRDGMPLPLCERDLRIATAACTSLLGFFLQNASRFGDDDAEPVCVTYTLEDGPAVTLTLPYEAHALFDVAQELAAAPAPRKVGRNAPCPCGSGKKYKKCHLPLDEQGRRAQPREEDVHALDRRLVRVLQGFARAELSPGWFDHESDFFEPDEELALQFIDPWSVYGFPVEGSTVAEHYLGKYGWRLTDVERRWLDAQRAAWLSIWEVLEVDPGRGIKLRDLLSHETRYVNELSASHDLVARDAVLGRVIDHQGISVLCGMHLRPLPPRDAAELVRLARGRLRRKGAVPPERLRATDFGRYLIRRWEERVEALDALAQLPGALQNTDGDALLLTVDHFDLTAGSRGEIESRILRMEGVERSGGDGSEFSILQEGAPIGMLGGRTLIGVVRLSPTSLRIESNSVARADALRVRLESACGELIRHRAREHSDPLSAAVRSARAGASDPPAPPELQQALRELKARYYAAWLDERIPALGDKTPREAVRTARGRERVDALLKEIENMERRFEGGQAFDVGDLRRELGLD
jgi:hypothetical protein